MPEPEQRVSFSRLVGWVEGRLPEDEARALEEQLSRADSRTLADVAWLRKFARAARNAALESPPRRVRDASVATFEAHAEDHRTPGFPIRILARLMPGGNLRPVSGVRAVDARRRRRQLVYSTDDFDLALNFRQRAHDKNLDLDGQVFPRESVEPDTFGVQLLRDGAEIATTATDDLGSFAFRSVPSGVYEMVLSTDLVEVSIEPFSINA